MRGMKRVIVLLAILVSVSARAADRLTILKAGPVGEVASLAEANEVRVVFSEPMVVLGKIPKDLRVPWFHVAPELKGTFRWSGTTTLIFTPDPKTPLPFATRYEVAIDAEAKSVAGKTLGKPYTFSFITPTILLLKTNDYRTANGALVIALKFNQPVDAQTIIEHLQLRTAAHVKSIPPIPNPERLTPADVQAFEAKKAKSQQAFTSEGAIVLSFVADSWDVKKLGPPSPDMVVLQTKPGIAYGTHLKIFLDSKLASKPTKVATGREQQFTIETPEPLFVEKISCTEKCDPDAAVYIDFTAPLMPVALGSALTVTDITDTAHPAVVTRRQTETTYNYESSQHHLDEFGYFLQPARKYEVRIAPALESVDGQTLGYTWVAVIDNWHRRATTSFGDGHGVWESTAGTVLPFYAENFVNVNQWMQPLSVDQLVPTLVKLEKDTFADAPPVPPQKRTLRPVVDKMKSYGVDIAPVLHNGKGLAWLALQPGETIPQALLDSKPIKATVVQVTNLGISVKDSPQNTLVFVTRLDNGAPVAGANVSIRTLDNKVFWSGTTDAGGIAIAPRTDLRRVRAEKKPGDEADYGDWKSISELRFVVIAEKEGDTAYAASNWNEGINPYEFEGMFNLAESEPMLRGTIFTDRGVYKPGEEVHAKVVLRSDTPNGIQLLPAGTKVSILTMNSRSEQADTRTVTLNEWSSAEWTYTIPADAALGNWTTSATVEKQRLSAGGEFLVAAYRRPEFRVDVKLSGPSHVAGTTLDGNITARYLFGAPMSKRPVRWMYTRTKLFSPPSNIEERWADRFSFLGDDDIYRSEKETISSKEQKLDANGVWKQKLETTRDAGKPYEYELEGEVTDVSRQKIAGRMSYRIDPAPWYVGVRIPSYFADTAKGLDLEVITPALDANLAAGVVVKLTLTQIQWNSVRRAEGNGFYTWDTEKKEVLAGEWTVTSAAQPAPLHIPVANGGQYKLTATASDGEGRTTSTRVWFYATGGGYTAWERFDHNRIELVPEKKTLKPGDTARIMIKSPWEHATALVTTEREGVRSWKPFELTSTQQTISVPVTEADIPNVFVSVLLIKGRSKEAVTEDASDPGKPAFRLGYTELTVVDAAKRLKVDVKANRDEYRPAAKAKIDVTVRDPKGHGARSEVTLWAVDYGVLSLTGYQTPNIIDDVYLRKALQVVNDDSRQKIISRRVLTAKGAAEGGGGGRDAGPGMIRKDFRVLAFWVGSLVTDGKGRAHTEVALPESLTTYRIMAVAADKASRFGAASSEIRINKPLLLTTTFPRFLAVGDKAFFGGVVHSQLKQRGTATVTIKSLDPNVLRIDGTTSARTPVDANGTAEVRFDATAVAIGTARVQMSVAMNGESDAFEDVIPVRILLSPETVAAYGEAGASPAKETLAIPSGVVPDFGGIHVDLSSSMMVGLGEGARYLVEYPYGCAEQRSSTGLALMLIADLGDAFKLTGIDAADARKRAQANVNELTKFQCPDGGFSFWPGECWSESPYLTAYVIHVLQRAQKLKYALDPKLLEHAYDYLDGELKAKRPENEGWWPAYTAWQAFAVDALVNGGRNEDSHINRLMAYADRMPLFGLAHLADALLAKRERTGRYEELRRRIDNAILPEGGSAHVEELNDPYLLWFWNSNVRSTAIVMRTLVRGGSDEELVKRMVRWLMRARKDGRWGNTQENAWAMEALVDYYRKYESESPDFRAVAAIGANEIAREEFRGRTTTAKSKDIPMGDVLRIAPADSQVPVTFTREGTGTLFYAMRLRYARNIVLHDKLDQGFSVERHYVVQGSKTDTTSFKAGDLIKVTIRVRNTKERRYVAVTDPIPAGTEPVESWFATTASDLADAQAKADANGYDWMSWWQHGGWDHVERHDDRVDLFATRLSEGNHEFTYMLRATTAGTFITAPLHAEEMYEPEVFGRTATDVVEVKK
jgi:uncharacterized protein YfaS (alpha-2-macroglobulin family)